MHTTALDSDGYSFLIWQIPEGMMAEFGEWWAWSHVALLIPCVGGLWWITRAWGRNEVFKGRSAARSFRWWGRSLVGLSLLGVACYCLVVMALRWQHALMVWGVALWALFAAVQIGRVFVEALRALAPSHR